MAYGAVAIYTDPVTSGASTSGGVNFQSVFENIAVEIPTMSTAAQVQIQHTCDGTNWYNAFNNPQNSSTVGTNLLIIATAACNGGGYVQLPYGRYRQIRFVCSATVTNGVQFKVVCF